MSTVPGPRDDRGDRDDRVSGASPAPEEHPSLTRRLTGLARRRHHDEGVGDTGPGDARTTGATGSTRPPGTGTRSAGLGGTTAPPRNVATGGAEPAPAVPADRVGDDGYRDDRVGDDRVGDDRHGSDRYGDDRIGDDRIGDDRVGDDRADRYGSDPGDTRDESVVSRHDHDDDSHGATAAAAGAAAGATGAAIAGRHDEDRHDEDRHDEDRHDEDRGSDDYAAGRADERAAGTGATDSRSDAEIAAADNRYARRDRGDDLDDTDRANDRRAVLDRERDKFGGARVGTGFFGWMAATGLAVLMTALTEAIGTAFGANPATSIPSVTRTTGQTAKTIGWGGTIVLLIIMFLAYLGGGYVAGRMARFHGIRQGLLVWLWGLVVAVIIAAIAHFAGTQYDILGLLNDFPRIPIDVGVTTWGIIALIVVALAGLLGALIGGLWGMSFHRRVDRHGLGR